MKKVLITGGATGIGRACAKLFIKKGYDVTITFNKTKPDYSADLVKCDLSKENDILNLFSAIPRLDILVNCAGVSIVKQINDTTFGDYDRLMNVNLKATYFCSREASKIMLRQHSGSIINISSMWGEVGASCETLYSMSKGGIIAFTKALSKELAPSGITVNCISPGVVNTRMNYGLDLSLIKEEIPLGRIAQPDEIANAVLFLAENDYITGQDLGVNGGIVV